MIKVGISGSSGYVAGELLRCLVNHPEVEIDFLYSHSNHGKSVSEIHTDLLAHSNLKFTQEVNLGIDVLFLCLGHGNSKQFLEQYPFSSATKVIDLSNDFRLKEDAQFNGNEFVYGLVESQKEAIQSASHVANPGCFATAIQLALLPLADAQLLTSDIHVHAITGSTGAGQALSSTSHFSWRNNNISIYKPFSHQHLGEIGETLASLQNDFHHSINFLPIRGDFTRGIFASAYMETDKSENELKEIFQNYYADSAFTFVSEKPIDLKQVVNTNHCFLHIQKIDGKVLITSVIDNLLKGAAGQAIQNMNLMFHLPETTGLAFKSSQF